MFLIKKTQDFHFVDPKSQYKVALKPLSRPGSHRSERFAPSLSSVAAQEPEKRAFEGHFLDF